MNQLYPIIRRIRRPLIDDRMEIPQGVVPAPVPPVVVSEPVVEEAPVPEPVPAEAPVAPVEESSVALEAPAPKRKKKNGDTAQS